MPQGYPHKPEASAIIQQAIDLHARHIDGSIPPTPESQQEMMSLLEQALEALGGGEPTEFEASEQVMQGYGKARQMTSSRPTPQAVFGE